MSDQSVVHVHIFGTEYKIASVADPDHTREVARYVDRKMREIAHTLSLRSVSQIAVLTVMNLAHELLKEEDLRREVDRKVCEKADRLAGSTDRVR